MAIAPRLDLRQSQTLVMTPQLRQAIKLLQFSNIEVNSFVEEEMERNPLLERDDSPEPPVGERAALDQLEPRTPAVLDAADAARSDTLPGEAGSPLDAEHAETYDPGGAGDGTPLVGRMDSGGGSHSFEGDDRGIDDFAGSERSLRDHLGEQLRLNFTDPVDRMVGAHLIALLCPAGRLTADPVAIAAAMGLPLSRVEGVRARMMRFDPVGLFARDLRECLAAQLAELNRLDPAMQTLLDNLELLAKRENRRLMTLCGVDAEDLTDMIAEIKALDPKPGATWDTTPPQLVVPDLLMRHLPDDSWIIELNPETMPRVLVNERFYAKVAPRANKDEKVFLTERLANANWLVRSLQQRAQTILKVAAEIIRQQDAFLRLGRCAFAAADPARHRRGGGAARKHRQPGHRQQIHRHAARHVRTEILLHHRDPRHQRRRLAQRRSGAPPHPWPDRHGSAGRHPVRRRNCGDAATRRCGYRPADGGEIPRGAADTEFCPATAGEGGSGLISGAFRAG